jgi:hypothetical protein
MESDEPRLAEPSDEFELADCPECGGRMFGPECEDCELLVESREQYQALMALPERFETHYVHADGNPIPHTKHRTLRTAVWVVDQELEAQTDKHRPVWVIWDSENPEAGNLYRSSCSCPQAADEDPLTGICRRCGRRP